MSEKRKPLSEEIKKYLRKEVGFGCPVPGCRLPFLEYHHFDPPYHEGKIHRKEGMIALCPNHHAKADAGAWTNEDLRKMKKCKNREPVKGCLDWDINNSILVAGKNFFLGGTFSLRVLGNEVFGLSQNKDGQLVVNALLWDSNGNVVTQIYENDIIANTLAVKDLLCTASGNKIRVESLKDSTYFEVTMQRLKVEKFVKRIPKDLLKEEINILSKVIEERQDEGKVPVLELRAKISTPLIKLSIQRPSIIADFHKEILNERAVLSKRFFFENGAIMLQHGTDAKGYRELLYLGK